MTKTEAQKRKEAAKTMRLHFKQLWFTSGPCYVETTVTLSQYRTILRALEVKKR